MNLQQIKKDLQTKVEVLGVSVILFYWKQCPYCQKALPIYEELKKEFAGKVEFHEYEVDELNMWDQFDDGFLNNAFKFKVVPTLFIWANSELEFKVDTAFDKEVLTEKLTSYTNAINKFASK